MYIRSVGGSVQDVGLCYSLAAVSLVLVIIPSGILSDKFSRKKMIILSQIIGCISCILFVVTDSISIILMSMSLLWMALALRMPAMQAIIAGNSSPHHMGRTIGLMALSYPVGGMTGPLIGGWISETFGWTPTFYVSAILILLCFFPLLFLKDETDVKKIIFKFNINRKLTFIILPIFLINIIVHVSFRLVGPFIPLYLVDHFNSTETLVGFFYFIIFIPYFSSGFIGELADKIGAKILVITSLISLIPLFILAGMANSYIELLVVYLFLGFAVTVTMSTSQIILMNGTTAKLRGRATAIRDLGMGLGGFSGPLIGVHLWTTFSPSIAFYGSALIIVLAIPIVVVAYMKHGFHDIYNSNRNKRS